MTRALPAERIELRLALVCYGGVSLAVYMHGVTKELHKLVQASRRFDDDGDLDAVNRFHEDDSAAAYYEALREIATAGRHLSVSIDVIAGTSAGGINGVVLGKVLACGGSQEKLKKLWIDEGDLKTLLRATPPIGGVLFRSALAGLGLLRRQLLGGDASKAKSPLKGERMSMLLLGAIEDIDASAGATLIPENGSLDLFVTATDLHGFEMLVPTGAGGATQHDRQHAQVLHFAATSSEDTEQFGGDATRALAFAARATSAFPGAFAPINAVSFGTESGKDLDLPFLQDRFLYPYDENEAQADGAWFVDGGVLDNAPFDHVVQAIAGKRADSQVVRRMVYIQPDPGRPPGPTEPPDGPPSWLGGLKQAVLDVKGNHDVLRDLFALRELNLRIAAVSAITEIQMAAVQDLLRDAVAGTGGQGPGPMSKAVFQKISDRAHEKAAERLGAGYGTYVRLKMQATVRRLADEVGRDLKYAPRGRRDSFLHATAGAWTRGLKQWRDDDLTGLIDILKRADMPYRERRMYFLLAGINALYPAVGAGPKAPERAQLDALKGRAWTLLEQLRTVPGKVVGDRKGLVGFLTWTATDRVVLDDPEDFAADNAGNFQQLFDAYSAALEDELGDGSSELWTDFQAQAGSWDEKYQSVLRDRYLAFPFWDGLIFPTVALAELPQFTPIGVAQYSPPSAGALKAEEEKLKGVGLAHFAGFLKSEWRQNDYLWGRLDGVELNLRQLYNAAAPDPAAAQTAPPTSVSEAVASAGGRILQQGLRGVLTAEADLSEIGTTIEFLGKQVAGLPVGP
jgi:patatin-related protein